MFALGSPAYLKCQEFPPVFRYWLKLWIDGFHGGTHIHWRISPLSLIGLAKAWRYFRELSSWNPQQKALIRMARRRRTWSINPAPMPETNNITEWNTYFDRLQSDEQLDRLALIDFQIAHLKAADDCDQKVLWHELCELSGYLLAYGYSTNDLFNRAKDTIIDAKGIKGGSYLERLALIFQHLRDPVPRENVVWTRVIPDTQWSNNNKKMFSQIFLNTPTDLRGDSTKQAFLDINGESIPHVVSRLRGSHSPDMRHRIMALDMLDKANHRLGKLVLDSTTFVLLVDDQERDPWKYGRKQYEFPTHLDNVEAPQGLQVGLAIQDMRDRPERLIDEIFRVVEDSKHSTDDFVKVSDQHKDWHVLGQAYHRCVRGDLFKSLNAYLTRLAAVFKNVKSVPSGVSAMQRNGPLFDHRKLLEELKGTSPDEDLLLIERLQELTEWLPFGDIRQIEKAYNSVHEAFDLLDVAKGIRNLLQHTGKVPFELYFVSSYLAAFMLTTYLAYQRREREFV